MHCHKNRLLKLGNKLLSFSFLSCEWHVMSSSRSAPHSENCIRYSEFFVDVIFCFITYWRAAGKKGFLLFSLLKKSHAFILFSLIFVIFLGSPKIKIISRFFFYLTFLDRRKMSFLLLLNFWFDRKGTYEISNALQWKKIGIIIYLLSFGFELFFL